MQARRAEADVRDPVVPLSVRLVLAAVAGGLLLAAFPPVGLWWTAPLGTTASGTSRTSAQPTDSKTPPRPWLNVVRSAAPTAMAHR